MHLFTDASFFSFNNREFNLLYQGRGRLARDNGLHVKSERSEYRCDGREDEINPYGPLVLCFWCHGFLLSF